MHERGRVVEEERVPRLGVVVVVAVVVAVVPLEVARAVAVHRLRHFARQEQPRVLGDADKTVTDSNRQTAPPPPADGARAKRAREEGTRQVSRTGRRVWDG